MNPEPDPESQERKATLDGDRGHEAQFTATMERMREIVRLRCDLHRIIPGNQVSLNGSEEPFIFQP